MALWGAPARPPRRRRRAACSARSSRWRSSGSSTGSASSDGKPPLAVGIGIHTGPLVAGYVGSSKALSYTVIGDTANTSARLCGSARAGQIVDQRGDARRSSAAASSSRSSRPQALKGKEKPLRIFNVLREKTRAVGSRRRCSSGGVMAAAFVLPFEKPVVELVERVRELRDARRGRPRASSPSSRRLEDKTAQARARALRRPLAVAEGPALAPPEPPLHARLRRAPLRRTSSSCTATAASPTTPPSSPGSRAFHGPLAWWSSATRRAAAPRRT